MAAVLQTPDVERKLRNVATDLRLDQAGRSVDELKQRLDELSGTVRVTRALWAAFAQEWKGLLAGLLGERLPRSPDRRDR